VTAAARRVRAALLAALLALACGSAGAQGPPAYASRSDVQAFVDDMVARHGFDRAALERVFVRVRPQPSAIRAMTPQVKGARSWQQYRARFVNAARIDAGAAFWARHEALLERAAQRYGVPPQIIVAIIGVETEYGRIMGEYRVADALATLAFDYPRRADFFRAELEQFLLLARELNGDPFAFRGSFAGAVGLPQFMPGSYRRYAVDFDGDGRRDLRGSAADAIGSVANFLVEHGWQRDALVALPATAITPDARALADGRVETTRTAAELRVAEVGFAAGVDDSQPAVLVELDSTDAEPVYWVGFDNFYVITRYNRSSFYAISVIELAHAIHAARGRQ
jgi:membrane-bound lytic murein transglycosylase B